MTLDPKALEAALGIPRNRWLTLPLREVFDSYVMPEPMSGCWLWAGPAKATKPNGGGLRPTFSVDGKVRYAYQVAYEFEYGPIPAGALVCHTCHNPMCVNPDHIYAGTAKSNSDDALAAGRHTSQVHIETALQTLDRWRDVAVAHSNETYKGRQNA